MIQLLLLFFTITFLCTSASASTKDKDFFEEVKMIRLTLNDKGYHFPDLGVAEEAFYKSCQKLDRNPKIKRKHVAILGGAFGKRAARVLQQTSDDVVVILNDIEGRHLIKIEQWSKDNGFAHRLILAPCSLLNIHKNAAVQAYFGQEPIKFHAILCANVLHHLPKLAIEAVRYIYDHLVLGCDAFLVNGMLEAPLSSLQNDKFYTESARNHVLLQNAGVKELLESQEYQDSVHHAYQYIVNRQTVMLYNFNKKNGISVPGIILSDEDSLSPHWYSVMVQSGGRMQLALAPENLKARARPFFYMMPQEVCEWAEIIGFKHRVQLMTLSGYFGEKSQQKNYFVHLRKKTAPDEQKYQELLTRIKEDVAKLKKLHANKFFMVNVEEPFIGIVDFTSRKICYTDDGTVADLGPIENAKFSSSASSSSDDIDALLQVPVPASNKSERKSACSCNFNCSLF